MYAPKSGAVQPGIKALQRTEKITLFREERLHDNKAKVAPRLMPWT
jgi:hypothetical protein